MAVIILKPPELPGIVVPYFLYQGRTLYPLGPIIGSHTYPLHIFYLFVIAIKSEPYKFNNFFSVIELFY